MNKRLFAFFVLMATFVFAFSAVSAQVAFDKEQYRIKHKKFVLKPYYSIVKIKINDRLYLSLLLCDRPG